MRRIFLLMFFLSFGLLYADAINSFTADKTNANPGDLINLTLDYTVSKKYELHFTAYNNSNNTELSPIFGSSSLKNITYTIPNDANYDVKIVAELIEDGNVVDSKQVIIRSGSVRNGLFFCSNYASDYSGITRHPTINGCFNPQPDVRYELIYGDDPGALIFLQNANADFFYSNTAYNAVAMGNAIIHYYNLNTNSISRGLGGTCYSGCCSSTTWGTDSARDCLNGGDTEDEIYATYQPEYSRIKIEFIGGYFSCSCSKTYCCGHSRSNTGYVYLLPKYSSSSADIFNDGSCIFYASFKNELKDQISGTTFTIHGNAHITNSYLDGQTNTSGGNYEVVPSQTINLHNAQTISIQIASSSNANSPGGWGEDILGNGSNSFLRFGKNSKGGRIYSHFAGQCCNGFSMGYLTDGSFHTYTLVNSSSNSLLYVDGVLQNGSTYPLGIDLSVSKIISGDTTYDGIDGYVKNLRVFNRTLTQQEILILSQEN